MAALSLALLPDLARALTCGTTKVVKQAGGGDCTSIQTCVNLIAGVTLTGNYCFDIQDNNTYNEAVTVQNVNNNGYRIFIGSDTGNYRPTVDPPTSTTAGFQIINASVTVAGINVAPTNSSVSYGVKASSSYVTISSVNVQDAGGNLTQAGVSLSNWDTVSYTSVTAGNTYGFLLSGSTMTAISYSTAISNSSSRAAIAFAGASSNTITGSVLIALQANAASVDSNSNFNALSQSTFTDKSSGQGSGIELDGAYNTLSGDYAIGAYGIFMSGKYNDVSQSSLVVSGSYVALYLQNASTNTFADLYLFAPSGFGVDVYSSKYNTFTRNTITAATSGYGALIFESNSSYNAFTGGYVHNSQGYGAEVETGSNGDVLSQSTFTSAGAYGLYIVSSTTTLLNSYVQGSTAVYVSASTGTTIGGSVLVATNTFGSGVWMTRGSVNLFMSSNIVTGGSKGAGVFLDQNNSGLITLSTNTINAGAQYDVYIATQTSNAAIWITSNTIIPTVTSANNTYGVYINGLTSGATIQNNGIDYRNSGSMGSNASYAVYSQSASGLDFLNNRVDQPGLITGGSYLGIGLSGTTQAEFKFNDVNSTGTGLANAYLVRWLNGSTGNVSRDNVFLSSVSVTGSSATLVIDGASASGNSVDYNDYFSSNAYNTAILGGTSYQLGASWHSGVDVHSITSDPLWFNVVGGVEDFHPKSKAGRYDPNTAAFVQDAAQSPTIDAGDPAEAYSLEPAFNGGVVNQGSYGDTAQASETYLPGNCATVLTVNQSAGPYTTIQAAVNAISSPLTGNACVAIEDGATYNEQVTVQNFANNGFSITIEADPNKGLTPSVDPPASSAAAFQILQASVNVFGINVAPTNAMTYGVQASSAYVTISSVNVQDAGGKITKAGVSISSWSAISYSSVTVGAVYGFWLPGSTMTTISYSTAQANGGSGALYLNGASNNTVTVFLSSNTAGDTALLDAGASFNAITLSTFTSPSYNSFNGFYLKSASSNTVSRCYFDGPNGYGRQAILFDAASNANTISLSTAVNRGTYGNVVYFNGASSNTVSQSFFISDGVNGNSMTFANSANGNAIKQSTMTCASAGYALDLNGASSNTITQSYGASAGAIGLYLLNQADYNTISLSTFTGLSGSFGGAVTIDASYNTVTRSLFSAKTSAGAGYILGSGNDNSVSLSTFTGGNGGLVIEGSSNTVSGSSMDGGVGLYLYSGYFNAISLSTMTGVGAGSDGLAVLSTSSNTVSQCFMSGVYGAYINSSGSGSTISRSTMTGSSYGVWFTGNSSSYTIVGSYMQGGLEGVRVNSTGTVIGGSIVAGLGSGDSAIFVSAASVNLTVSSTTILRGPGGSGNAGIYFQANTSGLINLSSNTINPGYQYGIYMATQAPDAAIWITSNTIVPTVTSANDSYGLYFGGLPSGATVQNNAFVWRDAGSQSGHTAYGLYAHSVAGLNVDHNRISDPGLLTAGSFIGAYFTGAQQTAFKFNDVNSTGTAFANAYLVQLAASTVTVRDNVFLASMTVSGSSASLTADALSGLGGADGSDYNDWYSSNSLNTFVWGAAAAQFSNGWFGQDTHSIAAGPLWFDPSSAGEDFHPKSKAGRYDPSTGGFVADAAQSLTIDAGDPAEDYSLEPAPNGSLVNQGSYGDTAQASGSSLAPGCSRQYDVSKTNGPYTTIQSAVNAIPAAFTGYTCIVVGDGATYAEQVTVQNFTNNGSSITIEADPSSGLTPVVSPPAASTAAFQILQSSVNVFGINIVPTNAMTYGVDVSSAYVTISSVNVQDAGGKITAAGVTLSSWDAVSCTSVTQSNVDGYLLPSGSAMTTISYSSAVVASGGVALRFSGASSNTVSSVYLRTDAGNKTVQFEADASFNSIIDSTMNSTASGGSNVAFVSGNSSNTISGSVITGGGGGNSTNAAVKIIGGGAYNGIFNSTITANIAGGPVVYMTNSTSNTISGSYVWESADGGLAGVYVDTGADANTISYSTVVSAGQYGIVLMGASTNTLNDDMITFSSASSAAALWVQNGNYNQVSRSTMSATASSGSNAGLLLVASSSNTFTQSYVYSLGWTAGYLQTNSNSNAISNSTMNTAGVQAFRIDNSNQNVLTGDVIANTAAGVFSAGFVLVNTSYTLMSFSTVTNAGWWNALLEGSSDTITNSYIQYTGAAATNFGGTLVWGSTGTTLNANTIVNSALSASGVEMGNGAVSLSMSSNTIIASGPYGVVIDTNCRGAVTLSTNTILAGPRYGIGVDQQPAGTAVWITSNTVIPTVTTSSDTAGIILNALTTGATIQNNTVVWRNPGTTSNSHYSIGIYILNAAGINILNNRISNPGMFTGGNFIGLDFNYTTKAEVAFNDFYSTGTAFNYARMLEIYQSTAVVRNNIFFSSMVASGETPTAFYLATAGFGGPNGSDYNDFYSSSGASNLEFKWDTRLVQFSNGWLGQDAHSISANPLWFDPSSGNDDFHPKSKQGRYDPSTGGFVADAAQSPTIDAGDPAEAYSLEPAPNGGVVNQGSYGNTAQASETNVSALALTGPPSGADVSTSTPVLLWSSAAADTSRLQLATDSGFTQLIADSTTADNYYVSTNTLSNGTTYWWRVAPYGTTNWSSVYTFVVDFSSPSFSGPQVSTSSNGTWTNLPNSSTYLSSNVVTMKITVQDPVAGLETSTGLPAGLVGQWHLDEGTGTVAIDASTTALNGVLIPSTITWTTGQQGGALSFNGAGQYVAMNAAPTTSVGTWTLEAWIRPAALPNNGANVTIAVYNGDDAQGYGFGVGDGVGGSGSKLQGLFGSVTWIDSGYTFPAANQWYHVAMARDGSTTRFYVNGVQTSGTNTSTPNAPNPHFTIGDELTTSDTPYRFFNGSIDEVRAFNVARSSAQILADYEADTLAAHNRGAAYNVMYSTNAGATWSFVSTNSVTLTGSNTTTSAQTLTASNIPLVTSTGPAAPTDQIAMSVSDYAGNVSTAVYTVLVDTTAGTAPAGCASTAFVSKPNGPTTYSTIQGAVNSLAANLTGNACVVVEDASTYAEQVTVQGFTNNGYTLTIEADPAKGLTPVVSPPAGSTAAFQIAQSSVNVYGINIAPTNAMTYGVQASSSYITISSVNVQDAGGKITAASIALSSSNALVSYSSVTAAAEHGVVISGPWNTISFSTFVASNADVIDINASSNTLNNDYVYGNNGVVISGNYNSISYSTCAEKAGGFVGAVYFNGSYNNVTNSSLLNPGGGQGLYALYNGPNHNTISSSTIESTYLNGNPGNVPSNYTFNYDSFSNGAIFEGLNGMISNSTFTTTLKIIGSSSWTVTNCYVYTSTALVISNSTGTIVNSSTLDGSQAATGSGVYLDGSGNVNLFLSSNTIKGGSSGKDIFIDRGNSGLINLSTNTINAGAQYGVYVATQAPNTALWITSNTIVPTVTSANNTYGLYINGLASGATIQNNGIYYRNSGSMGGNAAYGIYAQSASGLNFLNNRLDQPGLITGGSYLGISLSGTTRTEFKFNDVNSTGTGLANAYLVQWLNGSTGNTSRDNVFLSSVSVTGSSATLVIDGASASGNSVDYNDYFSSNSYNTAILAGTSYQLGASWHAGVDVHSITSNPLWFDAAGGIEDFHPKSTAGRYDPNTAAFVQDAAQSLTIDAGDPAEDYSLEPSPNGSVVNQGSYGDTAQASKSLPAVAGCGSTYNVNQTTGPYTTIQSAVNAIPSTLTGYTCVVINDGATYAEQVTVQNFTNNGSSITIEANPTGGLTPTVSPPAGSTAAFQIAQSSVNVFGINIAPTNTMPYGVQVSSSYVTISSVDVLDAGGKISQAGVMTSSWTTVSYASVTVKNAHGFYLPGSTMATISYSSAVNNSSSFYAVYLNGASSNTFTVLLASGTGGYPIYLVNASNSNTISQSTAATNGIVGIYNLSGSSNTFTQDYVSCADNCQYGVYLQGGQYNMVSRSTISIAGGSQAAEFESDDSYNTLTQSRLLGASAANAVYIYSSANNNTVSFTTITLASNTNAYSEIDGSSTTITDVYSNAGTSWGWRVQGSYNTISHSTVSASGGVGIELDNDYNTVTRSLILNSAGDGLLVGSRLDSLSFSTVTGSGAGKVGLYLLGASSLTATNNYIQGSTAVYVANSTGTVLGDSILVATNTAGAALELDKGSVNLALSSSALTGGAQGYGILLDYGNSGLINLSTNTLNTGAQYGVYIATQASNASIWITSNTIVPLVTSANNSNTAGLYLNGLTSGATIENNAIVYRNSGTMGVNTTWALYAQSASGLNIDHNRIDQPGMLTGGTYAGITLSGTTRSSFKFNDVNSTGTGLANAYLVQWLNGSSSNISRDNVFLSSMSVTGSSATLVVDGASASGNSVDYNDYFSSNAYNTAILAGTSYQLGASWHAGVDVHSITSNPLWFNAVGGVEDFHPKSTAGRYDPNTAGFVVDGADAPTIDAADPAEAYSLEPSPNGFTANQGSYGDTAEASKSAPVLSITLSSSSYDFGSLDPRVAASTISVSSVVVTNSGNVTETYALSATTTTAGSVWTLGTQRDVETPVLQGLFNSVQPAPADFEVVPSTLTDTARTAGGGGGNYAGDENGAVVPVRAARGLWYQFTAPTSTIYYLQQQQIQVTVTATTP